MRNRKIKRWCGVLLSVASVTCIGLCSALADPSPCEFSGQQQMLMVQMFMGLDMPGNATVSAKAWDSFLGSVVTPRFPDGLTVYDAYGQWWNPQSRSIAKEDSKVVVIVVADSPVALKRISEVAAAYKKQFRQISVGIVSSEVCAAF